MEQHAYLLNRVKAAVNALHSYILTMRETSLKPPMPSRAVYASIDIQGKMSELANQLQKDLIELEKEVDDIWDELEDLKEGK